MSPYQDALERIRAEYLEMPGMRLRIERVERLCGVDRTMCARVLDHLVGTRFLCVTSDGAYSRSPDAASSRHLRIHAATRATFFAAIGTALALAAGCGGGTSPTSPTSLVEIVPTPGSGTEPGLAFTVAADGRVTP